MSGQIDTLGEKIEALALKVADDALGEDVMREARIDALKVLTTYRASVTKGRKGDDDGPPTPTFKDMQNKIAASSGAFG